MLSTQIVSGLDKILFFIQFSIIVFLSCYILHSFRSENSTTRKSIDLLERIMKEESTNIKEIKEEWFNRK
jgi:cell division protein FtsL